MAEEVVTLFVEITRAQNRRRLENRLERRETSIFLPHNQVKSRLVFMGWAGL